MPDKVLPQSISTARGKYWDYIPGQAVEARDLSLERVHAGGGSPSALHYNSICVLFYHCMHASPIAFGLGKRLGLR